MIKKLRNRLRAIQAQQSTTQSLPRKVRFEALESRFLLSADISVPPPDQNQDNAYELEIEQTQITQALNIEEQQQIQILEMDPSDREADTNAEAQITAQQENVDVATTGKTATEKTDIDVTAAQQSDTDQATVAAAVPEVAAENAPPPPLQSYQPHEIIFVDPDVENYQDLIDGLRNAPRQDIQAESDNSSTVNSNTDSDQAIVSDTASADISGNNQLSLAHDAAPTLLQQSGNLSANASFMDEDTLVVILDANRDGIDQISEVLQAYQNVAAVHILSHGSNANVRLGNANLNSTKLKQYSEQLKSWGRAMTPDGDILLYGCNVANGSTGVQFVQDLGEITGADIAASNDETGSAALGGDWQLEVSTGVVETLPVFNANTNETYAYLLADYPIAGTDNADNFSIGATDVQRVDTSSTPPTTIDTITYAADDATNAAPNDNVAVNATDITDTAGTGGNDVFSVSAFPEAQRIGSEPGNDNFNLYGGTGSDTLDFSVLSDTLTFFFFDTTGLGKTKVANATHVISAADIETIIGGASANVFDFSDITAGLTFTFSSSGDVAVELGADSIVLQNAASSTIKSGKGNNSFIFETGAQFSGKIDGGILGNETFDFSASADLFTFTGFAISNGSGLNFTHNDIENVIIDADQINITGIVKDKLKSGLGDLVGDWAVDVETRGEIGQTLAGLDANDDVTLGKAIQITEALDQLRLDLKNFIDNSNDITAKDIQDQLSAFIQSNIQYAARAISGETFNPVIVSGDSFGFSIALDGGSPIDVTVAGNADVDAFVAGINTALDANPGLQGKVNALKVTQDSGYRIAFQVVSSDIDSFTLTANLPGQNKLGFAATQTISGLKDEIGKLGNLLVKIDDTVGVTVSLNFVNGLPELVFNFDLIANRSSDFGIDLGKSAEDIGLTFDADAKITVAAELNASLGLGLRLNDSLSDFFFDLPNLSVEARADLVFDAGVANDVRIGFLAAQVSGDMHLQAKVSTSAPDHSAPSMVVDNNSMPVTPEISDLDLDLSVAVDVNGLDTDLASGLGSFNKDPNDPDALTIQGHGDVFLGSDVDGIGYSNFDNLGLFGSFNAASFVSQVGTVRDWFGSVRDSDIFQSIDIPFVSPTLDKVFNLGDTVGDALLYDQGGDGKDDGATLVVDVRTALADAGLNKKVRVEGDGSKLTFLVTDKTISAITVLDGAAIGFEGDTDGQSADRDPDTHRLELTAATALASPVLSATTTFKIRLIEDGDAKEYFVTVTNDVTANNATIGNDHAKLLDENNAATFETTQDLANKLLEIIGIDENVTAAYDASTKRLTFALTFNPAQFEISAPVDFNFDLSPIGNIGTVGSPDITLGAGIDISLTLGLDLSDTPAGGGKDLAPGTELKDLNGIDSLADTIKTEYALSPDHLPLSSDGVPGELSNADVKFIDSGAEMTGSPKLTFTDTDHTIERSDGVDWESDGFRLKQQITISGTSSNNGTFTIQDIQGAKLILVDTDKLTSKPESGAKVTGAAATLSENPKLSFTSEGKIFRTEGSWIEDGFKNGDYIVIEGAGVNNGAYRIAKDVEDLALTLDYGAGGAASFEPKTDVKNVTIAVPDRIKLTAGPDLRTLFYSGQLISVTGTQSNNRSLLIADVVESGKVIILSASAKATNEAIANTDKDFKVSGGPVIRLSHDATFSIDGVPVTVLAAPAGEDSFVGDTSDNNNLLDLASDINSALDEAGLKNRIKAELNNGKIQLTARAELSGNPQLSFSTIDNTITRNEGKWSDDGFVIGQTIRMSGTSNNDDIAYEIKSVDDTDTVLTLVPTAEGGQQLNAETDSRDITVRGTYAFVLTTTAGNPARSQLGFGDSQTADSIDLVITLTDGSRYGIVLDGLLDDVVANPPTIQKVIDAIETQTDHKVKVDVDPDGNAGLRLVQVPALTGNPRVSFDATGNLIIREDSKLWSEDGFAVDQIIRVGGADDANNGVYKITGFADVGGRNAILVEGASIGSSQQSVKGVRITLNGDEIFRVEAANGSKIAGKLGILKADVSTDVDGNGKIEAADGDGIITGDAIAGASVLDRFFIQNPEVKGNVFIHAGDAATDGIKVTGDFGFVSVDLNGYGAFDTTLTLGLDDPTPDVAGITINELINSLTHISSIVSTPTIGGAKVSGEELKFDGKTITRTEKDTATGTAKAWGDDFAVGEYISVTGSDKKNDGHYKITQAEGSVLTVKADQDFTAETTKTASVLDEIGIFELGLDVNPDFGLINEPAADTTVALFDFGNPFADTDFKKEQFTLGDDEKSLTLSGDWTDRIKPGAGLVAELEATSFDSSDADTTNDVTKIIGSTTSFSLVGDLSDKFELGAKVTAELLAGTIGSSVTSKIKTINYNEVDDITTITLQDDVLSNDLVKVSIASKDASTRVVSLSYNEDTKLTTITVVDKILMDGVNSLTIDTPRGLDYLLQLPNFGDLVKFDNINIGQIIDGLIELSSFLGDFEAFGFLDEPIPLINVSINDVLSFADRFDAAVQEAQNNPAGTLQVLESKLKEALGIPSGIDSDALGFNDRLSSDTGILTGKAISDAQVADMQNDVVFLLSLDNGPSQLIQVVTEDANTVAELVDNVNTALSAAFATNVQARTNASDANRIEFFTADGKPLAISNPIDLSIFEDGDLQLLRIDFGLGIGFTQALDVNFDLGDSGILSGAAGLEASGAIDFALGLGIDLNNPSDVYLFDSSITGQLEAIGDDISFRAGIGPVGVFINNGEVRVGGDIGNKLFSLGLDFDGNNATRDGRKLISDIELADDFSAEFSGSIHADLPVNFPAETLRRGSVLFDASLSVDESGDLQTDSHLGAIDPEGAAIAIGDLFKFDLNELSLMDNMLLAVDGLDAFLGGLQDVLDGEVFGVPLPLVGDKLSDGAQFIGDLREDFIDPFRAGIETMNVQDENLVSQLLFDLLGPTGVGLLLDINDDGMITIADIILDTNIDVADGDLQNDYMQWNMQLGQVLELGTGIGLDLGIPGLGLETQGDINVELGWNLDFGFGISFDEAFYLDIHDDSELEVDLNVTLPDFGLSGQLAFLQLEATGNKDDNGNDISHFTAKMGVNVINKTDANDKRLAFSELGKIGLEAGIAGEAVVDLNFVLKLNSDLAPNVSGVFPKVVTDFYLDWSIDGDENTDGLQLKPFSELKGESALNLVKGGLDIVEFRDVSLDLGSFISDFIDPILGTVRDVTEPLQPIIDFLTTPLPVISDLGPDLTLLDIAKMTGKVDTGFIESIASLITFINAIPQGAESVLLNFGDFVIYNKSDSASNNLDLSNPKEDVQSKVAVPTGRTGTTPTSADTSKTKSFTDKLKAAGDFDFPIINDPSQIFNLLLGKDAVLMTYDLKPLVAEFSYKQSFPVYPPLFVAIMGQISAKADFAFGFDTAGITQFADSGFRNPLLIFNGFYVSDTNLPTGEFGTDVPELTLSGFLGAAAELNLGIASAGVGGGVGLNVYFDLFDPNHDGKVRVPEMVNSIVNEFRYGSPVLAPMALFDVSGDVYAKLFAYIEFLFFEIDFDITPPITLLEFDIPFTRVPTLASDIGDGVLQLNMGDFAAQRLNNNTTDGDETFVISGSGSTVNVQATFGGKTFVQTYNNVKKILALGGEGNDTIDLSGLTSSSIEFELDGGVGDDRIILSNNATGNAVITGGVGEDYIVGGGGNDQIYGGAGNDTINGGNGNDTIFGDEGEIAYQEDANGKQLDLIDYTRARVKVTDGKDVIDGGAGNDQIFGGGGEDTIQGGANNDLIIGDGGILRNVLRIEAIHDVSAHTLTENAVLEFIIDGESTLVTLLAADTSGNNSIEELVLDINQQLAEDGIGNLITAGNNGESLTFTAASSVLEIRVKGANDIATSVLGFTSFFKKVAVLDDTNRGDGKADTLSGGSGDDTIYGGRGDDTLYGNDNNDKLFGEDGFDLIYGNDGNDRLFGGEDNDELSGGAGDDHIEGGAGQDNLWGDWMVGETVTGVAGVDSIWGGTGSDTIFGGAGGDFLFGDSDADLIFGEEGNDTIDGGHGADQIFGGADNDLITSSLGDDLIDGGSGSDDVTINTLGGDMSSLLTVFDSGAPLGDGSDTLIVNGTEAADSFLLRAARADISDDTLKDVAATVAGIEAKLVDMGVSANQQDLQVLQAKLLKLPTRAFISKLNSGDNAERINYYDNLESIIVNTLDGNDYVVSDNTNAEVTINGGDGDDLFQIGQLFNSPRDVAAGIDPLDQFDTVQTTKGFLSNGINAPMTINGEDGNDSFVVFRNIKVLTLNGGDGDDEFLVKAFALEGSVDDPDRELTDITGAGGADLIQYAVNAPVGINGGDGLDTVIVLGTEFGDDFVVTEQGVYGAGLNVNFAGIEILKLDTAEGNDRIFVLGAGADHTTEIYAGEGSDAFFIAGDTPPITSQDLLGHSGIITQQASSSDARFDGANVDGISANVGDNDEPFIRIIKNDGLLRITEDGLLVASYSLVLTREPRALVGVTAIAQRPSPDEEKNGIEYLQVSETVTGTNQMVFDASNWFIPQTFEVVATQDHAYEAGSIATINHLVGEYAYVTDGAGNIVIDAAGNPEIAPLTDAPTYNGMAIPSVNVEIIDDNLPGLVIEQSDGNTQVIEGADFGAAAPFADEYTIRLNQRPDSDVTVTLINKDGQLQFEQSTFTFTPDNWDVEQTVRVIATDDSAKEGFHFGYIQHEVSSAQADAPHATSNIFAATNEAQARSTVLLDYAPVDKDAISSVQLGNTALNADRYSLNGKQLTILDKAGNPLKVTDKITVNYTYIKPGFQHVVSETIGVAIGDNDAPGVLVLQSGGSTNVIEADDSTLGYDAAPFTDQYQVVLTAKPDADVVIDIAPQPTKTSGRPPFVFEAAADNVAVTVLGFTEASDPTVSLSSGKPAPENGQLGGDLVFDIDLTPSDGSDATVQVTLAETDMADFTSIDDLIGGINTALADAGLQDKIFAIRDENRVVIAKVAEPQREQVSVSSSTLTFNADNWNIPQTVTVTAINDDVVDGGDIKVFAPIEQTVARIQGPLIINGGGGNGSDAGLGANPLRMPGESNDVGSVVAVPLDSEGNPITDQVVLDGKDIDKLGPTFFKSLDTFEAGDESNDAKAKVIIQITSGPAAGQERVVVARNENTFILAEDWDSADLPTSESRYIFIRELAKVNEAEQVDVATVFNNESVADNSGTLTATRLYGLGMGPDMQSDGLTWPGGLTYSNLENLTIHMGSGNDKLDVFGAQNREDFRTVTIVNTGEGDDRVTVDIEAENGSVVNGTVSASRTQHLQDVGASFPTEGRGLSGYLVRVTDVDGNVQERTILFNDGNTLYLSEAWVNLPQAGDSYEIIRQASGLLSINTQGGDDRVDASTSTAPLIAFGGLGADVLIGGHGDDMLIGDRGQIDYIDNNGNIITRLGSNDIPAPLQANPDNPEEPIVIFRQTDGVFRDPAFIKSIEPKNGGNDELHGGDGADLLIGGAKADNLFGDSGDDVLIGDGGQKVVLNAHSAYYETIDNFIGGNDTLSGGTENDILFGAFGNDLLVGNFNEDLIFGEYGRVTVENGKVKYILRLGQGSLDLSASTLFSLYGIAPYAAQVVPIPGQAAAALRVAAPVSEAETPRDDTRYITHASTPEGLPGTRKGPPVPKYHLVNVTDTLWRLADIYLGDSNRWPEIWKLNPDIKDPNLILPGTQIKLPQPPVEQQSNPPEDKGSRNDTLPAAPEPHVQGEMQIPTDAMSEESFALAGLGLVGLSSPKSARNKQRSALHGNADGAFIFDEFNSYLQPYYNGGQKADSVYQGEQLDGLALLTEAYHAFAKLQRVPDREGPVIEWDASYSARSTGN